MGLSLLNFASKRLSNVCSIHTCSLNKFEIELLMIKVERPKNLTEKNKKENFNVIFLIGLNVQMASFSTRILGNETIIVA